MEKLITVDLKINGQKMRPTIPGKTTLLKFLRDELKLTGTKNGCSTGHCGSCMVLVNGKATKSCLLKMSKLQNAEIITIEGLSLGKELHPIQAAFLATGAVQCGFCTPGMIIATKALLDTIPEPTEKQIRVALKGNYCRCTGYQKIIDAVKLAVLWIKHPKEIKLDTSGGYGQSVIDLDGKAKVTGKLQFADDLYMENMLYTKVVWSAHPHALIRRIDVEEAEQVSGVFKVVTSRDVPGHNGFGQIEQDQPVLCYDKVRFVGDAICMVLANSPESAERASKLIKIEYKVLPGSFFPSQLPPVSNICKHISHTVGNIEEALTRADLVLEGHFETPFVEHAYLEPEVALAYWGKDILIIKTPTQAPFELRKQLAKVLAMKENKIRVQVTPLGGGFGGKADVNIEPMVALGSYLSKRPVKLTLTREESLKRSTKRHPYHMDYKVGFDKQGKILFVDAKHFSDAGAYTHHSPRVIDQSCIFACGPYEVDNIRIQGWAIYTNNVSSSAFRGFGINQAAVAMESIIDEAAHRLNMNPFELRLKNVLSEGSRTLSGEILKHSVAIEETILVAQKALKEEMPKFEQMQAQGKKIGIGIACGFKNVGAGKGKVDDAGATFTLLPGGKVRLRASAVDIGQGIRTTLLQIAHEIIPLSNDNIELITGDTTLTHKHGSAVGERQTLISGNAVIKAGEKFKEKILTEASKIFAAPVEELELIINGIVHKKSNRKISLSVLEKTLRKNLEKIETSYVYIAPKTFALYDIKGRNSVSIEEYRNYPAYAYATQVAVVEVNPLSGEVIVLKVIAAHDVGRAINPQKIEGQIEGSCLMAQGYALHEEYPIKNGIPKARSYKDLKVPSILEAPLIHTLIVEKPDPIGPLGAKGISEVATVPLTPAILNAIYDAIGIRIFSLPATPNKILNEMMKKNK